MKLVPSKRLSDRQFDRAIMKALRGGCDWHDPEIEMKGSTVVKTRFWDSGGGMTTTAVQFRDDTNPMVHLHTNIGWVGISNAPKDAAGAEEMAAKLAAGYNLVEASEEQATYMLGDN